MILECIGRIKLSPKTKKWENFIRDSSRHKPSIGNYFNINEQTIQLIYCAAYVISREPGHEIKGIKTDNKR